LARLFAGFPAVAGSWARKKMTKHSPSALAHERATRAGFQAGEIRPPAK
jgi:hypothetical protein